MAEQCYDLMITGIRDNEVPEAVIKRLSSLCEKDDRLSELAIREAIFLNKKMRFFYNFSYTLDSAKFYPLRDYAANCKCGHRSKSILSRMNFLKSCSSGLSKRNSGSVFRSA